MHNNGHRLSAALEAIDRNTYQVDGQPTISLRLGTREYQPTVKAFRLDPSDLKDFLAAGGNLQFWDTVGYGPCCKVDRRRSVLFARWLLDAQRCQGVTILNKNKLDLLRSNLKLNFMGARGPERPLMADALSKRGGIPLPLDLSRIVQPCDLVGPFEALA